MKQKKSVQLLFTAAALYDGLLGLAFLIAAPQCFQWADLTPLHHWGYIQFTAAMLVIFALMFAAVAINPDTNRNLILYGILLKISYVTLVSWYWITSTLPMIWKPFVVFDLLFLFAFLWAYRILRPTI